MQRLALGGLAVASRLIELGQLGRCHVRPIIGQQFLRSN
jgi:hypothetical protein